MSKSVIRVEYSWIIGCDAQMEPEEIRKKDSPQGEASTNRATVARGSVTSNSDCFK